MPRRGLSLCVRGSSGENEQTKGVSAPLLSPAQSRGFISTVGRGLPLVMAGIAV